MEPSMADDHSGQRHILASSSSSSLANMSTFSLALDKFRRKSSTSDIFSPTETTQKRSRIPTPGGIPRPTPHGIPRTTSFFTSLSTFSSKTSATTGPSLSRARKISTRLAQRPFWTRTDTVSAPATPEESATNGKRRESSVQITQHKLMAPLGPPMPRSKTLAELASDTPPKFSPQTPHFARPTSSSEAKRRERVTSSEKKRFDTLKPTLRANQVKHNSQRMVNLNISETPTTVRRGGSLLPTYTPRASTLAYRAQARRSEAPSGSDYSNNNTSSVSLSSEVTTKPSDIHKVANDLTMIGTSTETLDDCSSSPFVSQPVSEVGSISSSEPDSELAGTSTPTPGENVRQVSTAMPSGYWVGRVSALSDRFRTEELINPPPCITPSPTLSHGAKRSKSEYNRGMHNTERRTRRVFIHLNSLCTTDEARASLAEFKEEYMKRTQLEDQWERGVKVMPTKKDKGMAKETRKSAEVKEGEVVKKLSVFERLLARKRKSRRSSLFSTSGEGPSNA